VADYGTEKLMKRITGRTDIEDALQRLDVLTKEENLMAAARNLEVTHRVDVNVMATQELTHRVDDKVTTIEEGIHDVDGNVKETRMLTRDVYDNVKVTRHGAQKFFQRLHTFHPPR
jgi:environmental stress-induced protein Ves